MQIGDTKAISLGIAYFICPVPYTMVFRRQQNVPDAKRVNKVFADKDPGFIEVLISGGIKAAIRE